MSFAKKITAKEMATLLGTSERTAKKYYADIKNEYGVKHVLRYHFCDYFGIQE